MGGMISLAKHSVVFDTQNSTIANHTNIRIFSL